MSIIDNRKAFFDYFIEDRYEAGLALQGDPFYLESADPVAFASALAIFASMPFSS